MGKMVNQINQVKIKLLLVFLGLALIVSFFSNVKSLHAASVKIPVGVQMKDTADNLIQAHGAGMIQVGSYYYMFGENRNPDWSFKAISMYRSSDFKNWEFVNDILTSSSHPDLNYANIERPKIIYNSSTGKYVLWAHKENGYDYGDAEVMVAYSNSVDGNYTYHGKFRPLGYDSRDMTLFNDNGTAYLISATRVNADMNIYRLTPDFLGVESLVKTLWPGQYREAPAMFKRNGVYFLLTSGATGWSPNQGKYATATSIEGNWSGLSNFGDSTTYDSQPTYVIPMEGSNTTSYVYMGDRWAGAWGEEVNNSRYVTLPLEFPSNTTLTMSYYDNILVDTVTGAVSGTNHGFGTGNYKLVNRNSGKTLSVGGTDQMADGAPVQQLTDTSGLSQLWKFVIKGNGYYSIYNPASGKYMDIEGQSTADGAHNIQWGYNGGRNQEWQIIDNGNGYYRIENRNSRKVLDIAGASLADGAQNVQWAPNWSASQEFKIASADPINLALNKSVTYSAQQTNYEASRMVDGDLNTRWAAKAYPKWIQVDLGAAYSITKTELSPYLNRAYQYKIETSVDGANYTQIVNRVNNTESGTWLTDTFSAIQARYVRLTIVGAYGYTGNQVSINEFRIY